MYDKERGLYIAHCDNGPLTICSKMANRHGLIAGATGTGKTVTLQVIAETFCQIGVPCFMADMKGDCRDSSRNASPSSVSRTLSSRVALCASSMSMASKDTPCEPQCRRWDHNCSHDSWA